MKKIILTILTLGILTAVCVLNVQAFENTPAKLGSGFLPDPSYNN